MHAFCVQTMTGNKTSGSKPASPYHASTREHVSTPSRGADIRVGHCPLNLYADGTTPLIHQCDNGCFRVIYGRRASAPRCFGSLAGPVIGSRFMGSLLCRTLSTGRLIGSFDSFPVWPSCRVRRKSRKKARRKGTA